MYGVKLSPDIGSIKAEIFSVGVGNKNPVPIPIHDSEKYVRDKEGKIALTKLVPETLKALSHDYTHYRKFERGVLNFEKPTGEFEEKKITQPVFYIPVALSLIL